MPYCAGCGGSAEMSAGDAIGQDLRMLVRHPRGNRIGGRAENHLDAGLAHGIHDVVHPRVLEVAILRFPQAPR